MSRPGARPALELAGFLALAALCALAWARLVAGPPAAGVAGALGASALLALALTRASGLAPGRRAAVAALACALALGAALLALGFEARVLVPWGWDELRAGLAGGLAGASELALPYDGPAEWTRRALLAPVAVIPIAAAAIAFWPGSRRRRAGALVCLLVAYAFAVTWDAPPAELAWGAALLVACAAYLWLPSAPRRALVPAAAAVALAGSLALAAATRVADSDPVVDYRGWALFGRERDVAFEWNHSYGPLEWPQRGTELLEIRSDRPLLWKTAVLDSFDGARWLRAPAPGVADARPGLAGASDRLVGANRERGWSEFPGIEVGALRSDLLVGAGITRRVEGIAAAPLEPDGTAPLADEPLTEGDRYAIEAYAPDPSPRLLRRSRGRYPAGLERYTALTVPTRWRTIGAGAPVVPLANLTVPLRGSGERPTELAAAVAGTPYERVHRLAGRLTRGARSPYDAVSAVARHLRSGYAYDQDVPERDHPLPAFLFRDRRGYCQQFSGAMALILRMAGIPSRVVTGFAPGYRAPDDNVYTVRDTDAHSWVEVWFRGIGWVPFDPTPGAAPAEAQSLAAVTGAGAIRGLRANRALTIERQAEAGVRRARSARGDEAGEGGLSPAGAAFALLALGGLAGGALAERRRRRLLGAEGARLQLAELRRALPRVGVELPPGATLTDVERLLAAGPGWEAARYAARLRDSRYAPGRPRRPGPTERRRLRRALGRGRGPLARLRAWRALPPGGPRRVGG